MELENKNTLLEHYARIYTAAERAPRHDRCLVAPSPELQKKLKAELARTREAVSPSLARLLKAREQNRVGFNDGLIFPGSYFPIGTPAHLVRGVAADRAPLRGQVNVIVVLVDFSDERFSRAHGRAHYEDLFFSEGVLPNGSVREYFADVTGGLVQITGEVRGPYRMPETLAYYANGESGSGGASPNARDLAENAAEAANADVDFGVYDNDGDGFVDAFIVLQAGPGAESTGDPDHIWSHKWVLPDVYDADGTQVYSYLTVPEEARIGVCCHELGHLLFGFPDLYDTDYSSSGVGDWCLMGGGSWNSGGDVPAHPSAWCKANQEWVTVVNPTGNSSQSIEEVKTSAKVYRLWKDGAASDEYFLVENRQRTGYDAFIPGDGLLIWHIDDAVSTNANETHPKVALVQADNLKDLEAGNDRGDPGDPFPGGTDNIAFNNDSSPSSQSYGDMDTCVAVENISASGPVMSADIRVRCAPIKRVSQEKPAYKEYRKELAKDYFKEHIKERIKEHLKDHQEKAFKEWKERKEFKEKDKDFEGWAVPPGIGGPYGDRGPGAPGLPAESLEARVAAIEHRLSLIAPFIGADLRPDLSGSALAGEEDLAHARRRLRARRGRAMVTPLEEAPKETPPSKKKTTRKKAKKKKKKGKKRKTRGRRS